MKGVKGFIPGVSGNPRGRPKMIHNLTSQLKKQSHTRPREYAGKENKRRLTFAQLIARSLLELAADGDVTAQALVFNRLDGKVPETLNVGIEPVSPELLEFYQRRFALDHSEEDIQMLEQLKARKKVQCNEVPKQLPSKTDAGSKHKIKNERHKRTSTKK